VPAMPPSAVEQPELLARLRAGDEEAFGALVDAYTPSLLRVARGFVPTAAVAEEVVQETWLGVLRGIDAFEGRSSLRTWIFRILINRARTRGARERRTVPFASLARAEAGGDVPAVAPERFLPADHERWPRHWAAPPPRWDEVPDDALAHAETLTVVRAAIDALPPAQRMVIMLRDMVGCDAGEVCRALDVTDGNQRVLLHRARSRVRAALEEHLT
jgi:RNA polymerase sigma-70 factor, ECF subfamily